MKLRLDRGLPYISVALTYQSRRITLDRFVADTGSAGTVFAADEVAPIGLLPEADDILRQIDGIGGSEIVFTRRIDELALDEPGISSFEIQVGGMSYGFDLDGIIGMDFLMQTRANIDLHRLEIYQAKNEGRSP